MSQLVESAVATNSAISYLPMPVSVLMMISYLATELLSLRITYLPTHGSINFLPTYLTSFPTCLPMVLGARVGTYRSLVRADEAPLAHLRFCCARRPCRCRAASAMCVCKAIHRSRLASSLRDRSRSRGEFSCRIALLASIQLPWVQS